MKNLQKRKIKKETITITLQKEYNAGIQQIGEEIEKVKKKKKTHNTNILFYTPLGILVRLFSERKIVFIVFAYFRI